MKIADLRNKHFGKPVFCLGTAPNLLTTCHITGSSNRAIKNMGWAAIENLLDAFAREP